MAAGPERGLREMDSEGIRLPLADCRPLHASRADLLRRLGRIAQASEACRRALSLVTDDIERRSPNQRLRALGA